jgi:aryl-alcohol dehydrogenase-like predicted oxidoreductase
MEKIAIGSSGLQTSPIGLGTWAIGGWTWGGTGGASGPGLLKRSMTKISSEPCCSASLA